MVEGARLESVYTPKVYRGFESLPLCHTQVDRLITVSEGLSIVKFYNNLINKETVNDLLRLTIGN